MAKKVGFANGCFDCFHGGHEYFLREANKQCDYLIVAVNDDQSVRQLKGPTRPIYRLHYRMRCVRRFADDVTSFDGNVEAVLAVARPNVVFRGWDQKTNDVPPTLDIVVIPRFGETSTTGLANGERQTRSAD